MSDGIFAIGDVSDAAWGGTGNATLIALFKKLALMAKPLPTVWKNVDVVAGTGDIAVWTPAAGKKFRLMGFAVYSSVAGKLIVKDGASTAIFTASPAAGGLVLLGGDAWGSGYLSAAANNALTVNRASSTALTGVVFGTEE